MKFLVSPMAGLKLRLLDSIVQARANAHHPDPPSHQIEPDKMTVCKAVEDRICKRLDLASRSDLTDQQVLAALRLLLKIVRRNDLLLDFSPGEIFLLTRRVPRSSREGTPGQHQPITFRS